MLVLNSHNGNTSVRLKNLSRYSRKGKGYEADCCNTSEGDLRYLRSLYNPAHRPGKNTATRRRERPVSDSHPG
jgi:hypothetical protein